MNRAFCIVWDIKAEDMVGAPILVKNENEAIRYFGDLVGNPQTIVGMHPTDFRLERVGFYCSTNDQDAQLVNNHAVLMTGERWLQMHGKSEEEAQA